MHFGYQQQKFGKYWGVGSPSAAELHILAPLARTFVETVVERDKKQARQKKIQCGV
jgi:hypothetical protein